MLKLERIAVSALMIFILAFVGCDAIDPVEDESLADYTCEGCHSSAATLDHVIEALHLEPHEEEGEEPPG